MVRRVETFHREELFEHKDQACELGPRVLLDEVLDEGAALKAEVDMGR